MFLAAAVWVIQSVNSEETANCIEMSPPDTPCSESCELMQADRAFNALAQEFGVPKAFVEFADQNAVMYRNGMEPIIGKEAIAKLLAPEQNVSLVWEPITCEMSESADLGYTRGSFVLNMPATDKTPAQGPIKGYYVTIWKKQKDGSWKWAFDSGIISQMPQAGK